MSQKHHYIAMLETIIEKSVNPTLERLGHVPVSLCHQTHEASVSLSSEVSEVKDAASKLSKQNNREPFPVPVKEEH